MSRAQSFVLNDKEKKVLGAFPAPGRGEEIGAPISIEDLASKAFKKKGTSPATKGNSWVRNSLRRLVRFGLVRMNGARSGEYRRTLCKLSDLEARGKSAHEISA
jgi:hypothetical protein